MLPAVYTSILGVESRMAFRDAVVQFSRSLGFDTVSAMAVVDLARHPGHHGRVVLGFCDGHVIQHVGDIPAHWWDPAAQ